MLRWGDNILSQLLCHAVKSSPGTWRELRPTGEQQWSRASSWEDRSVCAGRDVFPPPPPRWCQKKTDEERRRGKPRSLPLHSAGVHSLSCRRPTCVTDHLLPRQQWISPSVCERRVGGGPELWLILLLSERLFSFSCLGKTHPPLRLLLLPVAASAPPLLSAALQTQTGKKPPIP